MTKELITYCRSQYNYHQECKDCQFTRLVRFEALKSEREKSKHKVEMFMRACIKSNDSAILRKLLGKITDKLNELLGEKE